MIMPSVQSLSQQIKQNTQPSSLAVLQTKPPVQAPQTPSQPTFKPVLAPLQDQSHISVPKGIPTQMAGPAPLEHLRTRLQTIPFSSLVQTPGDFGALLQARTTFTQQVENTFRGLTPEQKFPLVKAFQNQFDLLAGQTVLSQVEGRLTGINALSRTTNLADFDTVKAQHRMAQQILNSIQPVQFLSMNSEAQNWFQTQEAHTQFAATQAQARLSHQEGDAKLALELNHLRHGRKNLNQLAPLRSFIVWKAPKLNDPVLTRTLLHQLPAAPVSGPEYRQLKAAYQSQLQTHLKDAEKNLKQLERSGASSQAIAQQKALVQFKKLMQASELSQTDKYKDKVNIQAVEQKLQALQGTPEFEQVFGQIRQKALSQVLGSQEVLAQKTQAQLDYLQGSVFQEKLYLLSPENQSALIQQELTTLYLLDPDLGQLDAVSQNIMLNAFQFHAEEIYANLPQEKQEEALLEVLEAMEAQKKPGLLGSALGWGKSGTHFLDAGANNIKHLSKLNIKGNAAHKVQEVLQRLQRNPKWAGRLARLDKLNQSGVLSQADSVLAVALLVAGGGLPEGPRGVATALQLLSRAEDYSQLAVKGAKLFTQSEKVTKFLTLGSKTVTAFKVLGPIGDGVSAVLDFQDATQEWEAGDRFGASMKYVSAGASVASGVAGATMILAPKSGKWAPALFLGATAVGLGAWGLDVAFGDTDEETLLKQLGVYQK